MKLSKEQIRSDTEAKDAMQARTHSLIVQLEQEQSK
jgi:hypothetical protein